VGARWGLYDGAGAGRWGKVPVFRAIWVGVGFGVFGAHARENRGALALGLRAAQLCLHGRAAVLSHGNGPGRWSWPCVLRCARRKSRWPRLQRGRAGALPLGPSRNAPARPRRVPAHPDRMIGATLRLHYTAGRCGGLTAVLCTRCPQDGVRWLLSLQPDRPMEWRRVGERQQPVHSTVAPLVGISDLFQHYSTERY
jgi:hypothetical protein